MAPTGGFPGGSVVKNPHASAADVGLIPRLGRSLEEEMATHSSILARKTPWPEGPRRPQSIGLWELDTTEQLSTRALCPLRHKWVSLTCFL